MPEGKWKKFTSETSPEELEKIYKKVEDISKNVENAYNIASTVFSFFQNTFSTIKQTLNTLNNLGFLPFEDGTDPVAEAMKNLTTLINDILDVFKYPSLHILETFSFHNPFFISEKKELVTLTFDEFFNKLYFHTILDEGDINRPIYQETTKVGGILLVAHDSLFSRAFELGVKIYNFVSQEIIENLDMEEAILLSTKFLSYKKLESMFFLNIPPEKKNEKKIEYEVRFVNPKFIFSKKRYSTYKKNLSYVSYPQNIFFGGDIEEEENGIYPIKLVIEGLGFSPFTINPETYLELKLVDKENNTFYLTVLLPEGTYQKSITVYVDKYGNTYRDASLLIPYNVRFNPSADLLEKFKNYETLPPDYYSLSLLGLCPWARRIYSYLEEIKNIFYSAKKNILDGIEDIVKIFEIWLDGIKYYIDEIKKITDDFLKLSDLLTSDGICGLYVEGEGVENMLYNILSAENRPNFGKGFYLGIFIVGEAKFIQPLANLFGLETGKIQRYKFKKKQKI